MSGFYESCAIDKNSESESAFPTSRCRSADTVTWVLKFSIDIYSKDMQKIMQAIMEKFVTIISF